MASRKRSLARENYHFTSHKPIGNKNLGGALDIENSHRKLCSFEVNMLIVCNAGYMPSV